MHFRRLKRFLPWIAVLAAASGLRFLLIFRLGTLWYDEAFSWKFAMMPFGRMLELLRYDVHPPLHAIILHVWFRLFGDGMFHERFLSFLTGMAGLVIFVFLGKRLLGRRPAFLAVVIAALSPLLVYYGADGRMYALVFALACLSSLAFWETVNGGNLNWKRVWFYASLALVLTHVTGAMVIAAQAAWLLRHPERRPTFKKLILGFLVIGASFAAWMIPAAALRLSYTGQEWQFHAAENAATAPQSLTYWIWLGAGKAKTGVVFVFAALCLVAGALRHSERRPWFRLSEEGEFLCIWFSLAFVPFLFVDAVPPRYLMAAVPPFFLLLAHGFLNAGRNKKYTLLLGVAAAVFFSFTGLAVQLATRPYNWDRNHDWIAERYRPGDRVVFNWFASKLAFDALEAPPYRRDLSKFDIRGLYPFDDTLDEDARIAAHAGTLALSKDDLEKLGPLFDGASRVFLIPSENWALAEGGSSRDALNAWLLAHGWFLLEQRESEGRTPPVWLMVQK